MNGDPIDAILQGEQKPSPSAIQQPQDALDSAIQGLHPAATLPGGDALDEALKGTGHVTPPSMAHRIADFVVHGLIIEPLKDVSAFTKVMLTGEPSQYAPSDNQVDATGAHSYTPATPEQQAAAKAKYDEIMGRASRGLALAGSFAGGPVIKAAPVIGPLLGKWTSFLTGEFLGGAIYGGVRPLDPDESRGAAMLNDGAMFAATGGILKGVGEGAGFVVDKYKRYILALPRAKRMAAMKVIQAERSKVEASIGTTLDQVHPEAAAKLEEPILAHAIEQADPGAVDLDAIVRAEADRAIEPTPRLGGERPALKLESPPEVQFEQELAQMKPMAGTTRGFEVTGPRKTPPVPTEPTVTEMLEGKKKEVITDVAVKTASGKVHQATGEVTHPELMANLLDQKKVSSIFEFIDQTTGGFAPGASTGYKTNLREFVSKDEAAKLGLEGRPAYPKVDFSAMDPIAAEENLTNTVKEITSPSSPNLPLTKVVDEQGQPIRVYRGSTEDSTGTDVSPESGAFFSEDPSHASFFTTEKGKFAAGQDVVLPGGKVTPAYLDIRNPLDLTQPMSRDRATAFANFVVPDKSVVDRGVYESVLKDFTTGRGGKHIPMMEDQWKELAMKKGYDGIKFIDPAPVKAPRVSWAVFNENQIIPAFSNKEIVDHALIDAATDHAIANINLVDVATPAVKDTKSALDQVISDPAAVSLKKKPGANVKRVMEQALSREGPAAEQGVVLELTSPGPREINLDKVLPGMRRAMKGGKSELAKSLEESAPIEISMGEQIAAPGKEGAEQLVTPKELTGIEIGTHLDDKQLDDLKDSLLKLARSEAGRVSGRLLIATTGGAMEALSVNDNLSPAEKVSLRTLGGFLILAAVHPRLAEYFKNNQVIRKFLLQYAPDRVMGSAQHPELFQAYKRAMTESRAESIIKFRDAIRNIVPLRSSHQAFMFAAEEGPSAPEWHLLTPNQQQAALVLNQLELHRGMLLKQEGVLDDYIDNYVRHLLPEKSYQTWRASGFKVLPVGGSFTKPRRINTLRELVDWTKKEGLEPPIMDPAAVYSVHNDEANRALATVRLKASLDKVGLIQDFDPKVPIPDKWRPVPIMGMLNKIAPDEVATALENISSPRSSSVELINSLDTIKGYWMRSIMAWPWEHGLNVLRSIPAIATNPSGFADIWRAVKRRDPGLMEAARAGVDLFSRPDYGVRSHDAFQRILGGIGLPGAGAAVDRKVEMMDRWLWEQIVPSLQYFAYTNRMHAWAERTKGQFLPSSVQYAGASHAAADFANIVAGRIPQELANPNLARAMRFAMFSPQWTTTRLALIAHASGELSDIVAGKLDPRDAAYLPFKMRQLAWGFAITWLGSKLMSGNEPQFNPNSSKFYMRTGLRNAKGHEIGLDVIGWWESDIQALNHPLDFMFNRLNPALKIGYETIQGRDYLGREMTTGQKISNIISSFGAGAAAFTGAADIATRALRGPPLRGGELLQMGSQASGAFNTATLPRPLDAAIAKFAKKILIRQNLPATNDNIFQLSRLLRSNVLAGTPMVDNQVINWLAYYKRSNRIANPVGSALGKGPPLGEDFQAMWQEARHVLAEF